MYHNVDYSEAIVVLIPRPMTSCFNEQRPVTRDAGARCQERVYADSRALNGMHMASMHEDPPCHPEFGEFGGGIIGRRDLLVAVSWRIVKSLL